MACYRFPSACTLHESISQCKELWDRLQQDRHPPTACKAAQPWLLPDDGDDILYTMFQETGEVEANGAGMQRLIVHEDAAIPIKKYALKPTYCPLGGSQRQHPATRPVYVTKNQNAIRAGFFDLPAELRVQIYEAISTACYEDYRPLPCDDVSTAATGSNTSTLPSEFASLRGWEGYTERFRDLRTISHQFGDEFVHTWAETNTFQLHLPGSLWRSDDPRYGWRRDALILSRVLANRIWTCLRQFLDNFNRTFGIGKDVRHVQVICQYPGDTYDYNISWQTYAALVRHFEVGPIVRYLERLDDSLAHPELHLELFVACTAGDGAIPRAKRIFRLRQHAAAIGPARWHCGSEWVCVWESAILLRDRMWCERHGRFASKHWLTEDVAEMCSSADFVGPKLAEVCPRRPAGQIDCARREQRTLVSVSATRSVDSRRGNESGQALGGARPVSLYARWMRLKKMMKE